MPSKISYLTPLLVAVGMILQLAGCSTINEMFPDRSGEYKQAQTTAPLEVPPDLTTTSMGDTLIVKDGSTTLSGYTSARNTIQGRGGSMVLPDQAGVELKRDKDRFWLVVQGDPSEVWQDARGFWLENGFPIVKEDPVIGTLETGWVESRTSIPQGPIRNVVGRVFDKAYTSPYQDRYRMRLEVGETPGYTDIYISHQGVQEIVTDANDEGATKWGPRPSDPGLESEMLKKMMIFLGALPQQVEELADQPATTEPERASAELIQKGDGEATLVVHEDYSRAWRSIGIALERIDFAVHDRDRQEGVYFVRYNDPLKGPNKKGLFSGWWGGDEEKAEIYQIKLNDDGADTRVVVMNEAGEPETSVTGVRILTLLYEQLR